MAQKANEMVVVKVKGPGKSREHLVHILGDVSNSIQGTEVKLVGLATPVQLTKSKPHSRKRLIYRKSKSR